jgi:IS5 family transposase
MVKTGEISARSMRVDTTGMEKNITDPTDIGLPQRARDLGLAIPKTLRSFARVSRKVVLSDQVRPEQEGGRPKGGKKARDHG